MQIATRREEQYSCDHCSGYSSASSKWQNRREAVTQSYGPRLGKRGRQATERMFVSERIARYQLLHAHSEVQQQRVRAHTVGIGTRERGLGMRTCCAAVVRFLHQEDGPTAVEYAVMLAYPIPFLWFQ